jgi:hypothetical protein
VKSYRVWALTSLNNYWTLALSKEDAIGQISFAMRIPTFDLEAEEDATRSPPEGAIQIGSGEIVATQAGPADSAR